MTKTNVSQLNNAMKIKVTYSIFALIISLGSAALVQAASTLQFSATTYTVAENAGAGRSFLARQYQEGVAAQPSCGGLPIQGESSPLNGVRQFREAADRQGGRVQMLHNFITGVPERG